MNSWLIPPLNLNFCLTVFRADELRQALMPTLEKLYRQDPESIPFRNEVDPIRECVPDYFDIIKQPMDLSKIKDKLDNGMYSDPWEYVDDVWLMFDNAWLYNRKTSRVYRYCTKVCTNFVYYTSRTKVEVQLYCLLMKMYFV